MPSVIYDCRKIGCNSTSGGGGGVVSIIDRNPRRDKALKEELESEGKWPGDVPFNLPKNLGIASILTPNRIIGVHNSFSIYKAGLYTVCIILSATLSPFSLAINDADRLLMKHTFGDLPVHERLLLELIATHSIDRLMPPSLKAALFPPHPLASERNPHIANWLNISPLEENHPDVGAHEFMNRGISVLQKEFLGYFLQPLRYRVHTFNADVILPPMVTNALSRYRLDALFNYQSFGDNDLHYVITAGEFEPHQLILGMGGTHLKHSILANWNGRIRTYNQEERLEFVLSRDSGAAFDTIPNNNILTGGTVHLVQTIEGESFIEFNNLSGHFAPSIESLIQNVAVSTMQSFAKALVTQRPEVFGNVQGLLIRGLDNSLHGLQGNGVITRAINRFNAH